MDLIQRLLDGSLMPHGHCLLWRGDLLFMHVGGDILTTLAYFTIPVLLIRLVKKRDDLAFDRIFLMFAAFIFLCGVTHLISLINVWHRAREEILEANSRLEQKVQERTAQLEALAVADPLTGTYRRTYALDTLGNELKRAQRYNTPLAVAMIDIDDFKRINDTHGHLAGDDVLRGIGSLLNTLSRESDTIGRFGGEEFLIVMPECDQTQAVLALERFNKALREHRFTLTSGETLRVTCSIGTTQATGETSQTELLANADKALYQAKHEGKDRVVSC